MAGKYIQRHINFSDGLHEEIQKYASKAGISFTEAVRTMCETYLTHEFDRNYAPIIGRMIEDGNNRLLRRIGYLLEEYDYLQDLED